jgi:hypothetical protein
LTPKLPPPPPPPNPEQVIAKERKKIFIFSNDKSKRIIKEIEEDYLIVT